MTFQTQSLMDGRVLVHGTDLFGTRGKTVVDGTQWAELNQRTDVDKAQQAFDSAVEDFFAPIMEAAEQFSRAFDTPTDSLSYVVLDEGSEGRPATPRQVLKLNRDSIILRLIEDGHTDRLMWIDETTLEILAAPADTGVVASGAEVIGEENMPESHDDNGNGNGNGNGNQL